MIENKVTENEVKTCTSCATGVRNADWKHLDDEHGNDLDSITEALTLIIANLELLGELNHLEQRDLGGYWQCDLCGMPDIATAEIFTAD